MKLEGTARQSLVGRHPRPTGHILGRATSFQGRVVQLWSQGLAQGLADGLALETSVLQLPRRFPVIHLVVGPSPVI